MGVPVPSHKSLKGEGHAHLTSASFPCVHVRIDLVHYFNHTLVRQRRYTKKMSSSLTDDDLDKVYRATFDARIKWKNVLLALKLSSFTINSISMNCSNNPDDCYREGLSEWLRSGERSWKDMVEALSSPTVDYNNLARTIEKNHVQFTAGRSSPKPEEAGKQCTHYICKHHAEM